MNEPEQTLTTADIERAVSRSVIKTLLWCLLVIPVVFALLGLIVTGLSLTLRAAPSGSTLEIGQDYGTQQAEPNSIEELTRLIQTHALKAMDVYEDGRVAVRPREGADIVFTLDPGILDALAAQHIDMRRVDVHRK
jgi:hypothetical protein